MNPGFYRREDMYSRRSPSPQETTTVSGRLDFRLPDRDRYIRDDRLPERLDREPLSPYSEDRVASTVDVGDRQRLPSPIVWQKRDYLQQVPVSLSSEDKGYRQHSSVALSSEDGGYRQRSPVALSSEDRGYRQQSSAPLSSSDGAYQQQSFVSLSSDVRAYRQQSPVPLSSDDRSYRQQSSGSLSSEVKAYRKQSPVPLSSGDRGYRQQSSALLSSEDRPYRQQSSVSLSSEVRAYRQQSPVPISSEDRAYRQQSSVPLSSEDRAYRQQPSVSVSSKDRVYRQRSPDLLSSDVREYRQRSPVPLSSVERGYRQRSPVPLSSEVSEYRQRSPVSFSSEDGGHRQHHSSALPLHQEKRYSESSHSPVPVSAPAPAPSENVWSELKRIVCDNFVDIMCREVLAPTGQDSRGASSMSQLTNLLLLGDALSSGAGKPQVPIGSHVTDKRSAMPEDRYVGHESGSARVDPAANQLSRDKLASFGLSDLLSQFDLKRIATKAPDKPISSHSPKHTTHRYSQSRSPSSKRGRSRSQSPRRSNRRSRSRSPFSAKLRNRKSSSSPSRTSKRSRSRSPYSPKRSSRRDNSPKPTKRSPSPFPVMPLIIPASAKRSSCSPKRSTTRSSVSPKRSSRRSSSRSPKRSTRRSRSRSPRRSSKRSRSRSPRRSSKRSPSRSPKRSSKRSRSRSPKRSSSKRSPSRSPKRSSKRSSRSPKRLSNQATSQTKKSVSPPAVEKVEEPLVKPFIIKATGVRKAPMVGKAPGFGKSKWGEKCAVPPKVPIGVLTNIQLSSTTQSTVQPPIPPSGVRPAGPPPTQLPVLPGAIRPQVPAANFQKTVLTTTNQYLIPAPTVQPTVQLTSNPYPVAVNNYQTSYQPNISTQYSTVSPSCQQAVLPTMSAQYFQQAVPQNVNQYQVPGSNFQLQNSNQFPQAVHQFPVQHPNFSVPPPNYQTPAPPNISQFAGPPANFQTAAQQQPNMGKPQQTSGQVSGWPSQLQDQPTQAPSVRVVINTQSEASAWSSTTTNSVKKTAVTTGTVDASAKLAAFSSTENETVVMLWFGRNLEMEINVMRNLLDKYRETGSWADWLPYSKQVVYISNMLGTSKLTNDAPGSVQVRDHVRSEWVSQRLEDLIVQKCRRYEEAEALNTRAAWQAFIDQQKKLSHMLAVEVQVILSQINKPSSAGGHGKGKQNATSYPKISKLITIAERNKILFKSKNKKANKTSANNIQPAKSGAGQGEVVSLWFSRMYEEEICKKRKMFGLASKLHVKNVPRVSQPKWVQYNQQVAVVNNMLLTQKLACDGKYRKVLEEYVRKHRISENVECQIVEKCDYLKLGFVANTTRAWEVFLEQQLKLSTLLESQAQMIVSVVGNTEPEPEPKPITEPVPSKIIYSSPGVFYGPVKTSAPPPQAKAVTTPVTPANIQKPPVISPMPVTPAVIQGEPLISQVVIKTEKVETDAVSTHSAEDGTKNASEAEKCEQESDTSEMVKTEKSVESDSPLVSDSKSVVEEPTESLLNKPWMNAQLMRLIRRMRGLKQLADSSKSAKAMAAYTNSRRSVALELKLAKAEYLKKQAAPVINSQPVTSKQIDPSKKSEQSEPIESSDGKDILEESMDQLVANPWMTCKLKAKVRTLNHLKQQADSLQTDKSVSAYNDFKNRLGVLLQQQKSRYLKKQNSGELGKEETMQVCDEGKGAPDAVEQLTQHSETTITDENNEAEMEEGSTEVEDTSEAAEDTVGRNGQGEENLSVVQEDDTTELIEKIVDGNGKVEENISVVQEEDTSEVMEVTPEASDKNVPVVELDADGDYTSELAQETVKDTDKTDENISVAQVDDDSTSGVAQETVEETGKTAENVQVEDGDNLEKNEKTGGTQLKKKKKNRGVRRRAGVGKLGPATMRGGPAGRGGPRGRGMPPPWIVPPPWDGPRPQFPIPQQPPPGMWLPPYY